VSISEKDIKRLWGLAAGKCSEPSCTTDCIQSVDSNDPLLIGEMAHVVAREEKGPRGKKGGGADTYENLILLCPTHHRMVDKAPDRFPGHAEGFEQNAYERKEGVPRFPATFEEMVRRAANQ